MNAQPYRVIAVITALSCAAPLIGCGSDEEARPTQGGGASSSGGSGGSATGGGAVGGSATGGGAAGGSGGGNPSSRSHVDCSAPSGSPAALKRTQVASGLVQPLLLTHAWGDGERTYIVTKGGQIHLLKGGKLSLFFDVDKGDNDGNWVQSSTSVSDERGLLGLAFHPDYAENGRFFVHYSNGSSGPGDATGDTVVAEYRRDPANSDLADPKLVKLILKTPQPDANHNGGSIEFSPQDGFLYIGLGDGGGSGDPNKNGVNKNTLLGAMLRIDVDSASPYAIPSGNITDGAPEIWDWGLRNPYRFNFDLCNGDLYIGDVGQGTWEEIDISAAGDGNKNWGWNTMEGNVCFGGAGCDKTGLSLPAHVYNHSTGGLSITGGHVYRGKAIPWLRGAYLYADFVSTDVMMFRYQSGSVSDHADLSAQIGGGNIASFGNDDSGEVYIVNYGAGTVDRIDPI